MQQFLTIDDIPFVTIDGRRALTGLMIMQNPQIAEFVKRNRHLFEYPRIDMDAAFLKSESALAQGPL